MILIEWGTCHGAFQLSFVRQLSPDNDQRDGMYTVTLQTTFPGDPRLAAVRDGNAWLNPTDPEFASTAQSLEGCEAVLAIAPTKWEVHAGRV